MKNHLQTKANKSSYFIKECFNFIMIHWVSIVMTMDPNPITYLYSFSFYHLYNHFNRPETPSIDAAAANKPKFGHCLFINCRHYIVIWGSHQLHSLSSVWVPCTMSPHKLAAIEVVFFIVEWMWCLAIKSSSSLSTCTLFMTEPTNPPATQMPI